MATLGNLVVSLEANIARFQSDMGKAVDVAKSSMSKVNEVVEGARHFMEAAFVGVSVTGIVEIGLKAIEAGDQLEKASIKAGMSSETMSQLSYAAKIADVSLEALSTGLKKMQVAVSEAGAGTGKSAEAFDALGLTFQQLRKIAPDQQFEVIADRISKLKDPADRARAATDLFGRAGADLLPLFEKGAAGIRAAREEADRLGLSFSGETTKKLAEAEDSIKRLKASWEGLAATLTAKVAPALTAVLDLITGKSDLDALKEQLDTLEKIKQRESGRGWFSKFFGLGSPEFDVGAAMAKVKAQIADLQAAKDKAAQPTPGIAAGKPPPGYNNYNALQGLKDGLDGRLKIIDSAIKAEDVLLQTGDRKLDADYALALTSLSGYTQDKAGILEKNFDTTQRLYDAQIAVVESYLKVARDQASRDAAISKLSDITGRKSTDALKFERERLALTEQLQRAGEDYARTLVDLDVQYLSLVGHTEAAVRLQDEMNDSLLRARLVAQGDTEALIKLDAIEAMRAIRASKKPMDGYIRALRDYRMSVDDVAKSIETMVGNTFGRLEDALTDFVATGKLSFKSLIDSMISDIARFEVRKNITGPLASFLNLTGFASGGDPPVGKASIVGENGPELFVPRTAGTIVPNGAMGRGGVTVSITQNIDAHGATQDVIKALPQILEIHGQRVVATALAKVRDGLSRGTL
jgi:hypothetical protein